MKHGRFRYCNKEDCQWFNKCGLALTPDIMAKAVENCQYIPLKEHCPNYDHNFSKREPRK